MTDLAGKEVLLGVTGGIAAYLKLGVSRGLLGGRLLFAKSAELTRAEHERRLARLAQLRDRIMARPGAVGIPARELELDDVWRLHHDLLNPGRARQGLAAPRVTLRDTLWAEETLRREGREFAEYTEAEQLAVEDIEEARGHLRQGKLYRRIATLKMLPEGGTSYFGCEPLLGLSGAGSGSEVGAGARAGAGPLAYALAVTVHLRPQRTARWLLNNQHALVDSLRQVLPFLDRQTVEQEEADRSKREAL